MLFVINKGKINEFKTNSINEALEEIHENILAISENEDKEIEININI